jgi:hypothetical protein
MTKFTFGPKLREGLGLILTEEGLEKALESAIEYYNWYIEKEGKAPIDFYCSFAGSDRKDFKNTTAFYDAKFIYEVMPYSFTFYVTCKDLIFEDSEVVEYDKSYSIEEFLSKDLSGVGGACVLVMFDPVDESTECFCRPDLMIGQILFDWSDSGNKYFIRVFGSYEYDIYEGEVHEGCRIMLPSRSNLLKEREEE